MSLSARLARAAYRRASSSAASTATAVSAAPVREQDLLGDERLTRLLRELGTSSDVALTDASARVAVLAHFAEACGRPVASNAYANLASVEDMARWYADQLKPNLAHSHARKLIMSTMTNAELDKGNAINDEAEVEDKICMARDEVQEEFMANIPSNLTLDPRTFKTPTPTGIRKKIQYVKPRLGAKKV